MNSILTGKTVLITGGTGSFGKAFTEHCIESKAHKIIIYSRDELKQSEMRKKFNTRAMRYFIGDIRDVNRLKRATNGVDVIVHAAAMKQVPACESDPCEAVKTNIYGAENVIESALYNAVPYTLALSTDKAVNPVNLYGSTKLTMEKLFVQGNAYAGSLPVKFSCTRYGNVVGSRGSVIPLFREQAKCGRVTITHPDMTRFWMELKKAVDFVDQSLVNMIKGRHPYGGKIYVPKLRAKRVIDVAREIAPEAEIDVIGIRPGEKLHEVLMSEHESAHAMVGHKGYTIYPELHPWYSEPVTQYNCEPFEYSSDKYLEV